MIYQEKLGEGVEEESCFRRHIRKGVGNPAVHARKFNVEAA